MFRMLVTIPSETALTLYELAEQERRTPRDQAAMLLSRTIQQERARKARRLNHTGAPQREQEVARAAS